MRRTVVLRWVGIAFLALAVVGAGLTWYLNAVFLPGPARRWIATQLAEQTGRRVQLGALHFNLWHGVTIDDLVVFEDRRYGDQPFLAMDRATLRGPWPTLELAHPRLRLVRDSAQVWNAESLRCLRPSTAPGRHRLTLIAARLLIQNGEVLIEDQAQEPGLDATLTRLDLRLGLNLPTTVSLKGTAQWQTVPVTPLLVQGSWNLRAAAGEGSVTARSFPLETVRPYLPPAIAAALRELSGSATITVKAAAQARRLEVAAGVTAPEMRAQWLVAPAASPWQFTGDAAVTGRVAAHRDEPDETWTWEPPAVTAQLRRVAIAPPAPFPAVERLDGTLRATPTTVQTDDLVLVVRGVPVRVRGTVTAERADRWPSAAVAVELEAEGPLDTLWAAAAPYRTGWLATAEAAGAYHLHGTVAGTVRAPKPSAALTLRQGRLTSPSIGTLEALEGRVVMEPNLLTAAGLRATWRGQPVQLDGTLVNFTAPEISGRATVGEVAADVALAVAGPRLAVTEVTATYRKSNAVITGTMTLGAPVTGALRARFALDAADALSLLPPTTATSLQAWRPAGRLKGECTLDGLLTDARRLTGQLSLHAGEFTARGIRLENLLIEYRQRDGRAMLSALTALLYGGTVAATGTLALDDPRGPFTAQLNVAHLELGRAASELNWKDQQISGQLSGDCQLQGSTAAGPASITGDGRFQVTNGRLFELPLLKGLADMLGAPALRRVVFRDAAGTYRVGDGQIATDDLTVYGDLATLTAVGRVTFAGALDARVLASIDPTAFERSPQFAHKLGEFLHQAGYLVGEIHLGGTLANPTYQVVPISLNRILKDQVVKRLGGLLGELLQ